MEAKRINLDEWGYLGEGGTATSYSNKLDGNLFLKLNRKGYPVESTIEEFNASRIFVDMGLPAPKVYDFVTDGERYGYTAERVKGKLSYARILGQDPERTDEICRRFAVLSKDLHHTPADRNLMKSVSQHMSEALGDFSYVPADVAEKVKGYLGELSDVGTCLHGDLNPGNVVTDGKEDFWIGVNSPLYGDPYWDIADMHVLCYCMPSRMVREIYHNEVSDFRVFYTIFKKYYFGEDYWDSVEVEERINHAAMVKCCDIIRRHPEYASVYVPLIRGNRLRYSIELWLHGIRNRKHAG